MSSYTPLPRVAYFCMEFGVSPELTIYSGGLGVLAGDYMKSVGDLGVPVVGIGILWDRGYTNQTIGPGGRPQDEYVPTRRDALEPLDVQFTVNVRGEEIACTAHRVRHYVKSKLLLIEPVEHRHRWITRSLYGGGTEDRIAQEILLGVGGVRLLEALDHPVDLYHFNEGHAVFAGHELLRRERAAGKSWDDAKAAVRERVVFTTHTPVPAGNESHDLGLLRYMGASLDHTDEELKSLGGSPYGMTVAGLRLCHRANGVAQLHGETAREMWKEIDGAAPILSVSNGVHAATWQDARIRAALVPDKTTETQNSELVQAHARMKGELVAEISKRTGVEFSEDAPLIGFARRAATYKRANLILGDPKRLEALFEKGVQLVFAGKSHPADEGGKSMVASLVEASRTYPKNIVYLENYDMVLGAMLTRGVDVWLNNPRRPKEACGTSGMKAAMNGVPNLSILDGWWPEGCVHGENGWQIKPDYNGATDIAVRDDMDRDELYRVLEEDVLPAYSDSGRWLSIMRASITMSQWHFSSNRMVEDYYKLLYSAQ